MRCVVYEVTRKVEPHPWYNSFATKRLSIVLPKLWMTMENDRALWQLLNDALSSANEMSISLSMRISPTISRAQLFDGSYDGRKNGRRREEVAESIAY
jgi:hypothetical protein